MNLLFMICTALLYATAGCQENSASDNRWRGKYAMVQTCDGATNPGYTLEIRSVANEPDQRTLVNLGGYGQRVPATVQGNSLVITPTAVNVGLMGQVQLSGTGVRRTGTRHGEELFIQLTVHGPGPQGTTTTSECALRGTPIDA